MDKNNRIVMLKKRLEELSEQCVARGIIIEDSVQYGSNLERHLEMEIQRMESALITPVQVLWISGLPKEHSVKYSLLNELGFKKITFSVN